MKTVLFFCISLLLNSNSFAQVSSTNNNETVEILNFKLTIFENSKEGRTYKIYYFTKKKIRIYDKPFPMHNYKEHLHTIHKYNSKELFLEVTKLNLNSLKEVYFNNCVDSTNGQDFSIVIGTKSKSSSTTLHHYYIKEFDNLMTLLNKYLPQIWQIQYLDKETKQDCSKLD